MMTYRGQIRNGVVVLDGKPDLDEGSVVTVEPVKTPAEPDAELPTLAERLRHVIGKAEDLPTDLAENHDHYLHGLPKKAKI